MSDIEQGKVIVILLLVAIGFFCIGRMSVVGSVARAFDRGLREGLRIGMKQK